MKKKGNVTNLFGKRDKNVLPIKNGSTSINVDINSLPDIHCIKCGEEYFINVTKLKKLSAHISPNGKEGNVNINMLKCSKCGWLFNPKEWQDAQDEFDEIEKKVLKDIHPGKEEPVREESIEDTIGRIKEPVEGINERRLMCRKCGEFYEEGEEHICKPI
jgi:hypothetical protein